MYIEFLEQYSWSKKSDVEYINLDYKSEKSHRITKEYLMSQIYLKKDGRKKGTEIELMKWGADSRLVSLKEPTLFLLSVIKLKCISRHLFKLELFCLAITHANYEDSGKTGHHC